MSVVQGRRRRSWRVAFAALVAAASSGCFSLDDFKAPCAEDGTCPAGFYCNASNVCVTCTTKPSGGATSNYCISTEDGSAACDPGDPSTCSGVCYVQPARTSCVAPGTGTQGASCYSQSMCAPGFECVSCYTYSNGSPGYCGASDSPDYNCQAGVTNNGTRFSCSCQKLCDFMHPDRAGALQCAGGTSCQPIVKASNESFFSPAEYSGDHYGPVVNGIWYGVCQ